MGALLQRITLLGPTDETTIEALVDTGATYTWAPRPVLEALNIRPTLRRRFVLADGREREYDMADVQVRLNGESHFTPCIFGDPGTEPLIGVVTLEEFGLGVDPVGQQLITVPGRLKYHALNPTHP